MAISTLHAAARAYAEAGIPVFPCIPGHKKPFEGSNGFHDATTDLAQIDQWWSKEPNANVAFSPGSQGWSIVDLEGPGMENWQKITAEDEIPAETWTVRTPRGYHLYYEGELPQTQGKLAPGIDTRTSSGYALLPPSHTVDAPGQAEGDYRAECEADVAPVPAWLPGRLAEGRAHAIQAPSRVALDQSVNIARSIDYLKSLPPMVEGEGTDHTAFAAAARLRDFAVSQDRAKELMLDHFPCTPCEDWWVDEKVDHAYRYAENAPGVYAVEPAHIAFAAAVAKLPPPPRSKFWPRDVAEMEASPDPEWLIPGLIPDRETIAWAGATGSFKSFLSLDLALAVATGEQTYIGAKPLRVGHVFYSVLEGRSALEKTRRRAWQTLHGLDNAAMFRFHTMPAPRLVVDGEVTEFGETIQTYMQENFPGEPVAMILIDTMAKSMAGMDEMSPKDAGLYVQVCDNLAESFKCVVMSVAHHGKDEKKGIRGSSAFQAGFGSTIEVSRAAPKSMVVNVNVIQHKDAPEPDKPWHLEGRSMGQSLVFQRLTPEEYNLLTVEEEAFGHKLIGAALRKLHAIGEAHAVTSHVLATALVAIVEGEDAELRQKKLAAASRKLTKLARGKLDGFVKFEGRDAMWFLPAA